MSGQRGDSPDRIVAVGEAARSGGGAAKPGADAGGGRAAGRLARDRRGSTAIMACMVLLTLAAAGALALDLGHLYEAKANAQRIADQSALAAAFAYSQSKNLNDNITTQAHDLGITNGSGAGATINAAVVAAPAGDGNSAIQVTVTLPVSLSPLANAISLGTTSANVTATAYAEMEDAACFVALKSPGITGSGGSSLTANGCAVASGSTITASQGASMLALSFSAVGAITTSGGATIATSPAGGALLTPASAPGDPYASGNIFSRVSTVSTLSSPSYSYGTGPSWTNTVTCNSTGSKIDETGAQTLGALYLYPGCPTVTLNAGAGNTMIISAISDNAWTGTINFGPGTYEIGGFYVGGTGTSTMTVNATSSAAVFHVWGGIQGTSGSGASLIFNGPATYYISGGIENYSSGSMTFTNSESTSATSSFTVDGSIAMTDGNGSFPDGTYVITSGGIYVGDHTLTFGNGSFNIVGGIDINQGGGTLTFGSALNANSVFQVPNAGSSGYAINTSTSSTLTIGSFTYVDLNGNVQIEGAATLGAGSYTINGFFSANSAGGGDFTALGVSIVASGQITFGQGYADIKLTAPATITTATLGTSPTIALATESTSTTTFTGGTSSTELVGAIYTPRSALSMINDGVISSNGSCSIVVASSINLSSSGSITSTCDGVTSTTLSVVSLVK